MPPGPEEAPNTAAGDNRSLPARIEQAAAGRARVPTRGAAAGAAPQGDLLVGKTPVLQNPRYFHP